MEYEKRECLHGLLKDTCSAEDSSEQWLRTTNRDGLYQITDLAFELFIELEIFTYPHLIHSDLQNMETLHKFTCKKSKHSTRLE